MDTFIAGFIVGSVVSYSVVAGVIVVYEKYLKGKVA